MQQRPKLLPLLVVQLFALIILSAAPARAEDRALLVGIDYYQDAYLRAYRPTPGSTQDARQTAELIQTKFGFPKSSVKLLLNEDATARNIEKQFREWLIEDTKPGDRVFFLYAGHGSQLPDDNSDEEKTEQEDCREDALGPCDETIAPFDVDPSTGANQIRDDVFDGMIARLIGRRAVLIFDSCHSGTISRGMPRLKKFPRGGGSRYLPSPARFKNLPVEPYFVGDNNSGLTRGGGGSGSRGSRDMRTGMVKKSEIGNLSSVVVISAASSVQIAQPIELSPGLYRGALSYAFAEAQRNGSPPLGALREAITNRIRDLHKTGMIGEAQEPQFEVHSVLPTKDIFDQPLFAAWEQAAQIALTNPASDIQITVQTRGKKTQFRIGENVSYLIETNTDGYLYLIVFSQNRVATCIFPNDGDRNNFVAAGTHTLPRLGSNIFLAQEPTGKDVVVALIAKAPLNIGERVEYSWDDVFKRLNFRKLEDIVSKEATTNVSRGVGSRVIQSDTPELNWQSATFVMETLP